MSARERTRHVHSHLLLPDIPKLRCPSETDDQIRALFLFETGHDHRMHRCLLLGRCYHSEPCRSPNTTLINLGRLKRRYATFTRMDRSDGKYGVRSATFALFAASSSTQLQRSHIGIFAAPNACLMLVPGLLAC